MPSFASRTCGSPDKKVQKAGKEAGDDTDDLDSGADAASGVRFYSHLLLLLCRYIGSPIQFY
jgi:hypothetical protein